MVTSIVRVATPAASALLTTLARVKLECDLDDTANDALLTGYIQQASASIAQYLGYPIAFESVTETFRLALSVRMLILARAPIVTIGSITVDGTLITSDQYETDDESGLLYALSDDSRIFWSGRRIVVAYSAGWTMPGQTGANLPPDLERAAILTVASYLQNQGRDVSVMVDAVQDVGRTQYFEPSAEDGSLPAAAVALLRGRKRWLVH